MVIIIIPNDIYTHTHKEKLATRCIDFLYLRIVSGKSTVAYISLSFKIKSPEVRYLMVARDFLDNVVLISLLFFYGSMNSKQKMTWQNLRVPDFINPYS